MFPSTAQSKQEVVSEVDQMITFSCKITKINFIKLFTFLQIINIFLCNMRTNGLCTIKPRTCIWKINLTLKRKVQLCIICITVKVFFS